MALLRREWVQDLPIVSCVNTTPAMTGPSTIVAHTFLSLSQLGASESNVPKTKGHEEPQPAEDQPLSGVT